MEVEGKITHWAVFEKPGDESGLNTRNQQLLAYMLTALGDEYLSNKEKLICCLLAQNMGEFYTMNGLFNAVWRGQKEGIQPNETVATNVELAVSSLSSKNYLFMGGLSLERTIIKPNLAKLDLSLLNPKSNQSSEAIFEDFIMEALMSKEEYLCNRCLENEGREAIDPYYQDTGICDRCGSVNDVTRPIAARLLMANNYDLYLGQIRALFFKDKYNGCTKQTQSNVKPK